MSYEWLNNFTQLLYEVTDKDMLTIRRPLTELGIHVTFKTFEIGCLIGGLIVRPAYLYLNRSPQAKWRQIDKVAKKFMVRSALAGLAIGPLLTVAYVDYKKLEHDDLYDRCYRLRYNKKQLHIDRSAAGVGAIGLYVWRLPGMVTWANIGIIYAIFYNYLIWDRSPRLIRDHQEIMGELVSEPEPTPLPVEEPAMKAREIASLVGSQLQ